MFGLLEPRLPVSLAEKYWVESRMCWMADTFGIDRLRNATVVLPTPEFFPDTFLGRPEDVGPMFERLCGYMGVPAGRFELQVAEEEILIADGQRCYGLYYRSEGGSQERIEIAGGVLQSPEILVPVLAHELSHALLLGDGHVDGKESDHEQLTDLFTVFVGMGVFMANDVVQDRSERMGRFYRNYISKRGYLPAHEFGYGLALFAWLRGETCPRWAKCLTGDGRESFRLGLRYITKTRDARFHPDWDGRTRTRSAADLVEELGARRAGTRYCALKELSALPKLSVNEVSAVVGALRDAHAEVRARAAETLGAQNPLPDGSVDDLRRLLDDDDVLVRIAATGALANVPDLPEGLLDDLLLLLDPERQKSAVAAAAAIQRFGRRAERLTPRLLDCLARSLAQCNDANTAAFCECLWAICEEPFAAAERHFGEARHELLADVKVAIRKSIQTTQQPQTGDEPDPGSGPSFAAVAAARRFQAISD